jgi:Protein of unknown function (DUF4233)
MTTGDADPARTGSAPTQDARAGEAAGVDGGGVDGGGVDGGGVDGGGAGADGAGADGPGTGADRADAIGGGGSGGAARVEDGGGAGGGAVGGAVGGEDVGARRREHAVRGTLAAGLILEGITVLFVPLAVARVSGLGATRLTIVLVLAGLLFVAAGLQRRPAGIVVGSALQVAVVATGVIAPAMYFLGLLFAGVWGYLLWVRQEITRAHAARAAPGRASGPTT